MINMTVCDEDPPDTVNWASQFPERVLQDAEGIVTLDSCINECDWLLIHEVHINGSHGEGYRKTYAMDSSCAFFHAMPRLRMCLPEYIESPDECQNAVTQSGFPIRLVL